MSAFPSEILMLIFSFLSRPDLLKAIRVSKHWSSVAIRILWRDRCFSRQHYLWYYTHLFKTYGQFVRHVELSGFRPSVDDEVKLVVKTCSNLTSVYFFIAHNTRGVAMLCENLSDQLESFQIRGGLVRSELSLFGEYISKLQNLKRLDVSHVGNFDDANCEPIVTKCQLLDDLNFKGSNITDSSVQLVAQHLPHIRMLNLSRCEKITNFSIIAIAKSCPLLTSLDIGETRITDGAFVAFTLTRISILNISECKMITDKSLTAIAKSCPLLKSLNISKCEIITDDSLTAIAKSCPLLASLDAGETQITDNALVALATARCRETITTLRLAGCNHITHNGLRQVVDNFTRLRYLSIRGCKLLTDELFAEPPWKCTKLNELYIGLLNVGSTALLLISNMTSLTSLDLYGLGSKVSKKVSKEVSKNAILSLAKLPRLQKLDVRVNNFVNDDIIKEIAQIKSLVEFCVDEARVSNTCFWEMKKLYPDLYICTYPFNIYSKRPISKYG
jgi:Leucine-rich repeat (LRR) protein